MILLPAIPLRYRFELPTPPHRSTGETTKVQDGLQENPVTAWPGHGGLDGHRRHGPGRSGRGPGRGGGAGALGFRGRRGGGRLRRRRRLRRDRGRRCRRQRHPDREADAGQALSEHAHVRRPVPFAQPRRRLRGAEAVRAGADERGEPAVEAGRRAARGFRRTGDHLRRARDRQPAVHEAHRPRLQPGAPAGPPSRPSRGRASPVTASMSAAISARTTTCRPSTSRRTRR